MLKEQIPPDIPLDTNHDIQKVVAKVAPVVVLRLLVFSERRQVFQELKARLLLQYLSEIFFLK
jgi:hypothetical protein